VRFACVALAVLLSAFAFVGCGYVGDPKPPTLDLPSKVTDLRAMELGKQVVVNFTLPPLTTEGLELSGVRSMELRVVAGANSKVLPVPPHDPGPVEFKFPADDWAGKSLALSVHATGPKGKTSDWSNVFALSATAPLNTPAALKAIATGEGVRLSWSGDSPHYRVFRSQGSTPPSKIADSDMPAYLDASAEFGMAYTYYVQGFSGELNQSEISATVDITPKDTFAPAVPQGLSAVSSVVAGNDAIELSWVRNTEPDFAGYNIFRSANGAVFTKIAENIPTPNYTDRMVMKGVKYDYAVSAVDNEGNESARSMTADASVPQ
jgi:hypothetical protein